MNFQFTVAVGDLVFVMIDGISTYRIVDEIGVNHLGQVGYRFGSQWYFDVSCTKVLRTGDIRTLKTFCPHRSTWNFQTIRVYDYYPTCNHRVAAVGTEHWDDHRQRWYSAGYVHYYDLSHQNWRSRIEDRSTALACIIKSERLKKIDLASSKSR